MTTDELKQEIESLKTLVGELTERLNKRDQAQIQLPVDENTKKILQGEGFLKTNTASGTATYYVAASSGGPVTVGITFVNGIKQ